MASIKFVKFAHRSKSFSQIVPCLRINAVRNFAKKTKKKKIVQVSRGPVTVITNITPELRYFRDGSRKKSYNAIDCPYGPPLAILFPWLAPKRIYLRKIINVYLDRGFDVACVEMSKDQFLFPGKLGHGVCVVHDLLHFLHTEHRNRPYVVHGFSIGAYIFGEMMAQLEENKAKYSSIIYNIKSCLWDSPVDYTEAAPFLGKHMHPNNILFRLYYERCVKSHLAKHEKDSVKFWQRSMNHFCKPLSKGPYIFYVSKIDPLSNPSAIQRTKRRLQLHGITTYEKVWSDSEHIRHFEKHEDEYIHGMKLVFYLSRLVELDNGKYTSIDSTFTPLPFGCNNIIKRRPSKTV